MKTLLNRLKSEIRFYKFYYLLLSAILILAFFVRVYRVSDLLQFYYDQGRDALRVWEFIHQGKPFIVGPVTGLAGIFLGPLYYYLITPFYFIGRGNPVYPAVFLSFTSILALLILYILGARMHSRTTGLLAAFIGAFSYNIFTLSRWLSNPTPMFLISTLFFWCLWEIITIKQKTINNKHSFGLLWVAASLLVGIALQFESASAVFYIPIFLIFTFWQRNKLPRQKYLLFSALLFFITLVPQIIFNFRHDNILINNFVKLFVKEKAFSGFSDVIFRERFKYFLAVYTGKLYIDDLGIALSVAVISFSTLLSSYHKFKEHIKLFSVFFLTPMAGYLMFQGNYGNIYDYYTIGYFLPLILFFSLGMGELLKKWGGFLIVLWFIYIFTGSNYKLIRNYLTATPATRPMSIEDQLQAVNWIYENSRGRSGFNIDVYVPPVIPYSYEYLFLWLFTDKCGKEMCGYIKNNIMPVSYTLYEADPPNPDRLTVWLDRQKGIGIVEEQYVFGQITVQRRSRVK